MFVQTVRTDALRKGETDAAKEEEKNEDLTEVREKDTQGTLGGAHLC